MPHHRTRSQISTSSISRPISQPTDEHDADLLPDNRLSAQPPSFSSNPSRYFDHPISIAEVSYHSHPLQSPAESAFALEYKEDLDSSPSAAQNELPSSSLRVWQPSTPSFPPSSSSKGRLIHNKQLPSPLPNPPATELPRSGWTPPKPSFRLLFKYCSSRELALAFPAIFVSLAAGGVAPYMSQVVGDSFNAFAFFPLDIRTATQDQKDDLRQKTKSSALSLMTMGIGFIILHTLMCGFWVWIGERNVRAIRREVYSKVGARKMEWFDLGMGVDNGGEEVGEDKEGGVGAAGLMSKFNRETDNVRFATSQAIGNLISDTTSAIACLVMAFNMSWSLTLVILSAIPVVVVSQGVVQSITFSLMASERRIYAEASTKAERATTFIATVKAFNAQKKETDDFDTLVEAGRRIEVKMATAWGFSMGLSTFILSAMFVAGFWFGAKLVREGKLSPGGVTTVFFATVLASNNVRALMPILELINKGKGSMVSLETLIDPPPSTTSSARPTSISLSPANSSRPFSQTDPLKDNQSSSLTPFSPAPSYPRFARGRSRAIPGRVSPRPSASTSFRPIRPNRCHGEFVLRSVDFTYPSRPHVPALKDVTVFLPAGETTFIVGGSGSGKSTISQLLLQLYRPGRGSITFDDQEIGLLDPDWMKEHLGSVQQGCILFDMSVHDNVALGLAGFKTRRPQDVTREEVVAACRVALMHDFIKGLPDGYETKLGNGGADLSGGQKQRLAIARAVIQNSTVLILDECTSALDAISKVLVFEAVKHWRKNRTTIVITHDLSQILNQDFVYLLKDGVILEEGYRSDLVRAGKEFARMANEQTKEPLPEVQINDEWDDGEEALETLALQEPEPSFLGFNLNVPGTSRQSHRQSSNFSYFDILAGYGSGVEYEKRASFNPAPSPSPSIHTVDSYSSSPGPSPYGKLDKRVSRHPPPNRPFTNRPRLSSYGSTGSGHLLPSPTADHRSSWRGKPSFNTISASPTFPRPPLPHASNVPQVFVSELEAESDFLSNLKIRGELTLQGRSALLYPGSRVKRTGDDAKSDEMGHVLVDMDKSEGGEGAAAKVQEAHEPSIFAVMRQCYPTVPNKALFLLAFITALGHGIITPLWANYLSILMGLVAAGGTDSKGLLKYSCISLGLALGDGFCVGVSYICFETVGFRWVANLRARCFRFVVAQDKEWFDRSENSAATIVQNIIKDADDMAPIVSTIPGHCLTAVAMIAFGTIWAMTIGWKLTLVGVAVIPVFGIAIGVQFMLLNNVELRNKRMREEVAKIFYESVSNVRAVRAMALESVFSEKFEIALDFAYVSGRQGAWIQGMGSGLMNGMVYFVEALLFFMISDLMIQGSYTYATALNVFSLIVFSITFASQMLAFLPTVSKAKRAAVDFSRLIALADSIIKEKTGSLRPTITGQISYSNVHFAYPSRPNVEVLSGVSFDISPGECVAIVGGSGSGKSTIAALLQRLYEPTSGEIRLNDHLLASSDTTWLRDHISIVSQTPALFDASVAANISYGSPNLPFAEVERACRAANVHDFILSLPRGYDTNLGENASLISGGQAQRLQIARALVKRADILILDECTSALDSDNQAAVLKTVMRVRMERTVVMVTHKLAAMQMCGRILVVSEGRIVEDGTFEELVARRGGVFSELAKGGEFESTAAGEA